LIQHLPATRSSCEQAASMKKMYYGIHENCNTNIFLNHAKQK
jgi:hypothetical protein